MVHVRRDIMSKVGDMIQEGREKSGLSMRQLADMLTNEMGVLKKGGYVAQGV